MLWVVDPICNAIGGIQLCSLVRFDIVHKLTYLVYASMTFGFNPLRESGGPEAVTSAFG